MVKRRQNRDFINGCGSQNNVFIYSEIISRFQVIEINGKSPRCICQLFIDIGFNLCDGNNFFLIDFDILRRQGIAVNYRIYNVFFIDFNYD